MSSSSRRVRDVVAPRGPLSAWLLERLDPAGTRHVAPPAPAAGDPLDDEDLQLALYLCYELHYTGLPGVDPEMEWDVVVLAFRRALECAVERRLLHGGTDARVSSSAPGERTVAALTEMIAADDGPSLSRHLLDQGTLEQFREFVLHRSAYQLKEADPHTWAIPRLSGAAKQALATIQAGEYGAEHPDHRMHSELFAVTVRQLGLDATPHAALDLLPASSLATVNLISLLGLHRRWRGALVGHLAVFEMTSVEPMRRYAAALRRLGAPDEACRFYDVHVLADAVHEQVAADMVRSLVDAEPGLARDVLVGARAVLDVERRFAEHLLTSWRDGRTSLRRHAVAA